MKLHVVVLSCGALGAEVAARLVPIPGVSRVSLVTAPYRTRRQPLSLGAKVRHVYRTQGLPGLLDVVAGRVRPRRGAPPANPVPLPDAVRSLSVDDFHSPESLAALSEMAPDLGVVAGTYILRESVFSLPRLGSINLHSGKVPQYRGAAPAFWELYNGEHEVGITIHRVAAAVDAGAVLAQETFPLDPAPPGDPIAYIERYRRDVLRPEGVRLLAEVVAAIAEGRVTERPQDSAGAHTYRSPEYRHVRELRRRVRDRRRQVPEGSDAA